MLMDRVLPGGYDGRVDLSEALAMLQTPAEGMAC